jgi:hypothetical protein
MGVVPNFFRLAPDVPEIAENFWGFAKFAYMDSPLPSVFKERLFVHLSRFCEVRYCLGRHLCFLVGLGNSSGDPRAKPLSIQEAVGLLRPAFTPHLNAERHLEYLRGVVGPLPLDIKADSDIETSLFALCTAIFVNPSKARPYLLMLRRLFAIDRYEHLLLFIGFVRMAHYWTQVHPELREEEDLEELMRHLEKVSWALAWDSQAGWSTIAAQVNEDVQELRMRSRLR